MNASEQHKATYLVNLFHLSDRFRLKTQTSSGSLINKTDKGTSFIPSYYGKNHVPVRV